jgi:transcriptional regulator with XRE-family HTH domain
VHATAVATRFESVNTGRAESIRARRVSLGISAKELALRAGVDRGTLAALEAGEERVRDSTFGAVERALDALEQEMGVEHPRKQNGTNGGDVVEFRVSGDFGVDVVVKGPVRDMDALEASVSRLLDRLRANQDDDTPGD